ncbi:hypothetical protein F183_A17160 [Bryobacterales bacterium F-183]|nr:hypothetical protein F183_A17160 [Bryobacterales bacterium F-183]
MKLSFALALLAVSAVRADVIVQTQFFNLTITDSTNLNVFPTFKSQGISFTQFNPAWGTLTSVQYTLLDSVTTRNLTVTGSRNSGQVNSTSLGSTTGLATLVGAAPLLPVFGYGITASCSANTSCTASPTLSNAVTGTTNIGTFGGYIGLDAVTATLTLTAGRTAPVGLPISAPGLTRSANIDATWSGKLQLEYIYTPAASVPEPSVWAPFALSGVLLAARSLRRKQ